jgi:hypothetical protein
MVGWLAKCELEMMWMEAIVAQMEIQAAVWN